MPVFRLVLTGLLGIAGGVPAQRPDSQVGWNIEVLRAAPADDAGFEVFGPQSEIRLRLIVKNEQGDKRLVVPAGFQDLIDFDLLSGIESYGVTSSCSQDGRVLPPGQPTASRPLLLDVGSAAAVECVLEPATRPRIDTGEYRLRVSVARLRANLQSDDLTAWTGTMVPAQDFRVMVSPAESLSREKPAIRLEAQESLNRRDYAQALRGYRELLGLDQDDADARGGAGMAYFGLGQYDKAVLDFEKCLAGGQGRGGLITRFLAYAYVALGQEAKAAAALASVLPADEVARQIELYRAELKKPGR